MPRNISFQSGRIAMAQEWPFPAGDALRRLSQGVFGIVYLGVR